MLSGFAIPENKDKIKDLIVNQPNFLNFALSKLTTTKNKEQEEALKKIKVYSLFL